LFANASADQTVGKRHMKVARDYLHTHYHCTYHMLSEYKARKRKCMDFVNDLADAMEKHPREVMSNDKILGLDTDEMEWGWWLDCGSWKVFGMRPKEGKKNKKLLGGGGRQQQQRHDAREGEKEEKNEPTVKIPAKYMDV
jgi:hypothetical protein